MISRILALIVAAALISGCDPTSAAGICDVDRGFDEVPWLVGDSGVATPIRCPGEHPAPGRGRVAIVDEPETGWVVCGCYHDADEDGQHDQGEAVAPADTLFSYERQSVRYDLILNSCADLEQQCDRRYIGGAATTVKPYAVQPLLGVNPAGPFVAASSCQVVPLFDLVQKAACSLEVMREATVPRGRCDSGANRALRCLQKYPRVTFLNTDPLADCRAVADDLGGWRLGTLEAADDCVDESDWISQVTRSGSETWPKVVSCIDDDVRAGLEFERPNPDHDRVCSDIDNCDEDPNDDQVDCDNDDRGNLCDDDRDGDEVPDVTEEDCGTLHTCASDFDGDNLEDFVETLGGEECPDSDNDGLNDVVDEDSDNDGLDDGDEVVGTCANGLDPYRVADCDADGVPDPSDNCPLVWNEHQENADLAREDADDEDEFNVEGDACDDDIDGDEDPNGSDNCPHVSNQGQEDIDGDGLGDSCEVVIHLETPGADFPTADELQNGAVPKLSSVKIYPANHQPVLTFQIEANLESTEPLEDLSIQWHIDPVGDVQPQFGETHLSRSDGNLLRAEVSVSFLGMPALATDFGRKRIGLSVSWRGRVIAEVRPDEGRTIAVGWRIFNPGPHMFTDPSFAKNHPGDDLPLPPVHPNRLAQLDSTGRSLGDWAWARSRAPNWFYYFVQMEQAGLAGAAYLSDLDPSYVALTEWPTGFVGQPFLGMAVYQAGADIPQVADGTLTYETGTSDCHVFWAIGQAVGADSPAFGTLPYVVNFHVALRHEFEHFKQRQRWSRDGRGAPFLAHRPWLADYWSHWGPQPGLPLGTFNHYRDLDGDEQFNGSTACDLNADGDEVDELVEALVTNSCWDSVEPDDGGPPVMFDVNFDGLFDSPLYEWNVESLDWDGDRVPNWEDPELTPFGAQRDIPARLRNWETDAYEAGEAFSSVLLAADPFRETDWSCPGVNIPLESCQ